MDPCLGGSGIVVAGQRKGLAGRWLRKGHPRETVRMVGFEVD